MSGQVETEYRHIVKTPGICGGEPIIRGTRTSVRAIVGYYRLGMTVEEILEGLPHLTPAQVYSALSYYHDNVAEIEREIANNERTRLLDKYGLTMDASGRLTKREERKL